MKKLRRTRHINQKELARRVGVTQAYISILESEKRRNPNVALALRIAKALECSVEELGFEPPAGRDGCATVSAGRED